MGYVILILVCFGVFFLMDKGFQKLFRGARQHKSGRSVRLHKRFATMGLFLMVLGLLAVITGATQSVLLLIGGIVVAICGAGMLVYYLSFGFYYDTDDFLVQSFGKKSAAYRYADIINQQLYSLRGGATMIELHMRDGTSIQLTSQMPEYDQFLNYAFERWCVQRGVDPDHCDFHDPDNSLWFPNVEV